MNAPTTLPDMAAALRAAGAPCAIETTFIENDQYVCVRLPAPCGFRTTHVDVRFRPHCKWIVSTETRAREKTFARWRDVLAFVFRVGADT